MNKRFHLILGLLLWVSATQLFSGPYRIDESPDWLDDLIFLGNFEGRVSEGLISELVGRTVFQVGEIQRTNGRFGPGFNAPATGDSGDWFFGNPESTGYMVVESDQGFFLFQVTGHILRTLKDNTGNLPFELNANLTFFAGPAAAPEPTTILLVGLGLLACALMARRFRSPTSK